MPPRMFSLIGGVMIGLLLGGGVGVFAAPTDTSITVCANKKTNMLRYAKNKSCSKTETKVVLDPKGTDGEDGVNGIDGIDGTDGATGATGPTGSVGATGEKGATGEMGATGPIGATGPAGTSSPTGFTVRSVCGANGTTLCAVGVQGPGGGLIFYIDETNEIPDFDYLEAAPTDASSVRSPWATNVPKCGTSVLAECTINFISDLGSSLMYTKIGTGKAASNAIISRHEAGGVAPAAYAAGVASEYSTATASDWWLPSKAELMLVRTNLYLAGIGGLDDIYYWSSTEKNAITSWVQMFINGNSADGAKDYSAWVRPIRGF